MRRRTVLTGLAGALAAPVAGSAANAKETPMALCCPVVELRQYIMQPGQRDVLIELFEREFVEPQEALGIRVIGTFRDLDRPDRFVWMRGFADMESRGKALEAFYFGPVWQTHRSAANATLLDNDDVLQLRPHAGFDLPAHRAPVGAAGPGNGLITANLWYGDEAELSALFESKLAPLLAAHGATPIAWFTVEHAANSFPRLPVREGETALVWLAAFGGAAEHAAAEKALGGSSAWAAAYAEAARHLGKAPERLRLEPTARSLLHG